MIHFIYFTNDIERDCGLILIFTTAIIKYILILHVNAIHYMLLS